ncbi:diphosphomevalonate decarboxylase [Paenibacillus crassostreae]|uniref:diphosphomevalonate decarboxylase n=1 Tax=Paenibacillus crassostreae TaxID=1763538 RepID=A0A167ASD0_9BACL|nr:diphosphomevalonate decarboxylase [Paenibacillus crassostreae]AOZ93681.1 diphosphomevalonate decarboxylase [Paenibacillus crassostreae]OAB71375.1 diphosphomevalonate decarboxylase [Paenibacillus crassostreae]
MIEKKVRAYTNIALIKYWGKRNEEVILPTSSSLSLTLDAFYTETAVSLATGAEKDIFYLNNTLQSVAATEKVSRFLNLFREATGIQTPSVIRSTNYVPTSAGLASSASGMAALAGAANLAYGLNLDPKELSKYARRGSGSATRSIYGGFVEWQMGTSADDSYAVPIDDANWDIGMVVIVVNSQRKAISSRIGMKNTVETSPFYAGWLESTAKDLVEIKEAIRTRDFQKVGEITESNGMKMHGTMLGANPPLSYWEPNSIMAMQMVRQLRNEGIPCYFTMDAGPNVKVLCRLSDSDKIKTKLAEIFDPEQLIIAGPGQALQVIAE